MTGVLAASKKGRQKRPRSVGASDTCERPPKAPFTRLAIRDAGSSAIEVLPRPLVMNTWTQRSGVERNSGAELPASSGPLGPSAPMSVDKYSLVFQLERSVSVRDAAGKSIVRKPLQSVVDPFKRCVSAIATSGASSFSGDVVYSKRCCGTSMHWTQ